MTELETFPPDWYDVVDFDENNNPKITEQTRDKIMEKFENMFQQYLNETDD